MKNAKTLTNFKHYLSLLSLSSPFTTAAAAAAVDRLAAIINTHPFPDHPLLPTLRHHLPPPSAADFSTEDLLDRLFAAHANGLKALEVFKYSLRHHAPSPPTAASFEKTLHILTRMRYFSGAWDLLAEIAGSRPEFVTLKSMSILLSKITKFGSFDETLAAFDKLERVCRRKFGTEEFNVVLSAFCRQREMKEARSVFLKMHGRFSPNVKTMNILLLGFKESGDVTSMELFYHEMVKRRFRPNGVSYGIRIDGYCKRGHLGDALRLFDEMVKQGFSPTLEIMTTLVHGAGVARNAHRAKELFDEIGQRGFQVDTGAYNALISSLVKSRDADSAVVLMNEMEEKGIRVDNVTYHTVFFGLMKSRGIEGVCALYYRMIDRNFVPKARTVVMLMKFFCVNCCIDLGLELWGYLLEKGHCPHSHALELLVTGLCSRGRLQEACECCKQFLQRGMLVSESVYQMLTRLLTKSNETDKLTELKQMMNKLQPGLPPSRGCKTVAIPFSTATE